MDMEEMDLLELWNILMKRKVQIIICFILAVAAAGLISMSMEPVYQATATLMLKTEKSSSLAALDPLGSLTGASSANVMLQNYIYMLTSRSVLTDVFETMGLESVTDEDIRTIKNGLTVQQVTGTEILEIKYESRDREFAADFVNTLSNVFIDTTRDDNRSDLRTAREYLAEQIEIVAAQLKEAEEKLRVFRETERVIQPMQDSSLMVQRYMQWDNELAQTQIAKIEVEQRLAQIQDKLLAQDEIIISSTTIQNNPLVQTYQQRLADLEIALSGARELYTERHPEVLSLQAEIQEVRSRLANEVERVIATETQAINPIHSQLYSQLISTQVELSRLNARNKQFWLRDAVEYDYINIPEKELELVRLMREVNVHEDIYLMLMTRYED